MLQPSTAPPLTVLMTLGVGHSYQMKELVFAMLLAISALIHICPYVLEAKVLPAGGHFLNFTLWERFPPKLLMGEASPTLCSQETNHESLLKQVTLSSLCQSQPAFHTRPTLPTLVRDPGLFFFVSHKRTCIDIEVLCGWVVHSILL